MSAFNTCVIMYCIDNQSNYIDDIIKSFESVHIDMFYVLNFNNQYTQNKKIKNINMKNYDYNINLCYNKIKHESANWIIWKSTYYVNEKKINDLISIINNIACKKYNIAYIFGIKLYLDNKHVKKNDEFSCKNGGCFIVSNNVELNEKEIYFSANKGDNKIFYNLYNSDEYYFFDMTLALSDRLMLINDFESTYMSNLREKKTTHSFSDWYQSLFKPIIYGDKYIKKKYVFDCKNILYKHSFDVPNMICNTKKQHNYYSDIIFFMIINSKNECELANNTIKSILNQNNNFKIVIIVNGTETHNINLNNSKIHVINNKIHVQNTTCYKNAFELFGNEIIGLICPGTELTDTSIYDILDAYNTNKNDNVFVHPNKINKCILHDLMSIDNFITFKLKHFYEIGEFTNDIFFGNEFYDILLKLETICRPICVLNIIKNISSNSKLIEKIKQFEQQKIIANNVVIRYKTNDLKKIKKFIVNEEIFNKNIFNVFFDAIYTDTKVNKFEENKIKYTICNDNTETIIKNCKDKKNILICKLDDNISLKNDFIKIFKSNIKNIYLNWKTMILGHNCVAYNIDNIDNIDNTTYFFDPFVSEKKHNPVNIFDPYPKISIIMTVYNKEKYLKYAIESILKQTYKNLELILVEDCSTDTSKKILLNYKNCENVVILENDVNSGCYVSRNRGIKRSTGSIIGFQDADDYSVSTRIEKQLKLMLDEKLLLTGCNMIRSHIQNINYENDDKILSDVKESIVHLERDCCNEMFGYPTLLIKKEMFDKHGLYIERKKGMDMEFPERIFFKELGYVFDKSSWEFFDKEQNNIYQKLEELLVISPDMNDNNITNNIENDDFLKNKNWRNEYKK